MNKVIIIAEAGVNHNGSIEIARKLIEQAAIAGVDYVKFQSFVADLLVSKTAKKADYQQRDVADLDNSQYSMLKKLELSVSQHKELISYCKEKSVKFLSTAFDMDSIGLLASLKLGLWKVPSGEITNRPYLKKIALKNEPVIISTGMCEMADIQNALDLFILSGLNKKLITVLHCNTEYPTPMEDVNLKAMTTIANTFGVKVGYSDHTRGIEVPIAAVALGACVIEKHFTLDRNMDGPDHKASLEPDELRAMVSAIRNIEKALGNGVKEISPSERKNIYVARKSIIAKEDIKKGAIFTEDNLTTKRPGNGISPMKWDEVIGKIAPRDFIKDDLIQL
jgi:N,N'-diacetyllegionaminate synthase